MTITALKYGGCVSSVKRGRRASPSPKPLWESGERQHCETKDILLHSSGPAPVRDPSPLSAGKPGSDGTKWQRAGRKYDIWSNRLTCRGRQKRCLEGGDAIRPRPGGGRGKRRRKSRVRRSWNLEKWIIKDSFFLAIWLVWGGSRNSSWAAVLKPKQHLAVH